MKISDFTQSLVNSPPVPFPKPPSESKLGRCRTRKPVVFAPGTRWRKRGRPARRLDWKLDAPAIERRGSRRLRFGTAVPVSARKLAAGEWHLAAEVTASGGGGGLLRCGQIYRLGFQHKSLRRFPTFITEAATKWDLTHMNLVQTQQAQLLKARTRIQELKADRRSLNKKVLYLMLKLYEERISCTRRESQKLHPLVDDLKQELNGQKRDCERMKILNSKLLEDLAEVTLSAKEFMVHYEKERKTRIFLEEICQELAKKIEEGKAEVEEIKREFARSQEGIEEERKMLQLAEVWREERVQVKMFDAKLILEEKYRQMNNLVVDLESFLSSRDVNLGMIEMSEAEVIREAANSVRIDQDIKEFTFLPLESNNNMYSTNENGHKDEAIKKLDYNELNEKHVPGNSNSSYNYKPEGNESQESLSCMIGKFCSVSSKKPKNNLSSLCKPWKSSLGNVDGNGVNESRNPHITRGIQGCIEWPQGIQKMKKPNCKRYLK